MGQIRLKFRLLKEFEFEVLTYTRGRVRPGTRSLHVWSGQAGLEIKSVGEPTCPFQRRGSPSPCQGSPGQALKGFLSMGGGGGGVRGLSAVRLRSTKNQGETVDLSKVQNRAERYQEVPKTKIRKELLTDN